MKLVGRSFRERIGQMLTVIVTVLAFDFFFGGFSLLSVALVGIVFFALTIGIDATVQRVSQQ